MTPARYVITLVWFNGLLPLALLTFDWFAGYLGANPVEAVTRTTGVLALVLLTLTLCASPLAQAFKQPLFIRCRRALGLLSFTYALVHLVTYLAFDREGALLSIPGDIAKRPFVTIGFMTFLLLVPLAITSTDRMIRRLGAKRWQKLHRLTYATVIGGVIHYDWIVKSDVRVPLYFGLLALVLLAYRLPPVRRRLFKR